MIDMVRDKQELAFKRYYGWNWIISKFSFYNIKDDSLTINSQPITAAPKLIFLNFLLKLNFFRTYCCLRLRFGRNLWSYMNWCIPLACCLQFAAVIILKHITIHVQIQEFLPGGSRPDCQKTALTTLSPLLIRTCYFQWMTLSNRTFDVCW